MAEGAAGTVREHAIAPGWWHSVVPLDFGFEICAPHHSFGPAVRRFILIHYVLEGEGTFLRGGETYRLGRGDLFVIQPGEVTTYRADGANPWQYFWIGFQAESVPEFLRHPVLRQMPVRALFEDARDRELAGDMDGYYFSMLYEVLWRLSAHLSRPAGKANRYAAYVKVLLETSYMRQVSIQQIADSLHIDRRYLTILFREAYGLPPQAYLMQLRLEQARKLLVQGYGVTEAATMAGFTDLSNFSRQYKQYYGTCPSRQRTAP